MTTNSSKMFYGTHAVPDSLKGAVIAIGNFDGVHLGHRHVFQAALGHAKQLGVPAMVLTFEPHPRTWFNPKQPVFRLTNESDKAKLILDLGFDGVIIENFDADFAGQEAVDFTTNHLHKDLNVCHVVTGFNFYFGKNRGGTPEFLNQEAQRLGFGLTQISAVEGGEGDVISSSMVRAFLRDGNVKSANALLGYEWQISSTIVKGAQLGRTLGFPTANMKLPDHIELRHGIYAVKVTRENGEALEGVASFGRRPTFDNGAPLLETFIFDFSQDIYDESLTISFVEWIREELKFDSQDALVVQMNKDVLQAQEILAKTST
ncbi:MAG: bifunctional riboflavin kinase/FAD synthetase [Nitratireductor sp.]